MTDLSDLGNIELPIVTVFGAGVGGLSAAHELIERGFRVQLVEPKLSPTREYECAVGGLAANQFTRVRAALQTLQPWLMQKGNEKNLAHALKFRDWQPNIEKTAVRFPINQKLRFDKLAHHPSAAPPAPARSKPLKRGPHEPSLETIPDIPAVWQDYWDAHGVRNRVKLQAVFEAIRDASQTYMRIYFPKLADLLALGREPAPGDWKGYSDIFDTDADAREFVARETFFVRIVAYTDTDNTEDVNRIYANDWAQQVYDALLSMNRALVADDSRERNPMQQPIWELERRLEIVVRGSAGVHDDPVDPRQRSFMNRVEFEVVEQIIPGEHGFHFFPGFYRHLFDTMKRTPVFNGQDANSTSAYDQLVPTPHPQLALEGALYNFDFRAISSLTQLRAAQDLLTNKLGFKPKDVLGLQFKSLRYLTSGAKRREKEAEPINLFNYLGGEKPDQIFSNDCLKFIDRAPRALAAMSARESDARTQFDITAQLLLPGLPDPMTLNGPTSLVWLDHWKAYLKRQGVKFFIGQITAMQELKPANGAPSRYVPVVIGPTIGRDPELHPVPEDPDDEYRQPQNDQLDQHRFVLATHFQEASRIVWDAFKQAIANGRKFEGPFRQFIAFDELSGRRKIKSNGPQRPTRNPITGEELGPWPLRTISGLQFFFPQAYRFGQSNIYFAYSPYGLTSISQYAYWRRSQPVGQLLGQISVDIGDWHAPYPKGDVAAKVAPGHPAFYSSSQEIADATWAQIKEGLSASFVQVIEQPRYYHLDTNMVFSESCPSSDPESPGWWSGGAIRANAKVSVPDDVKTYAQFALVTNRKYQIELRVGADGDPVTVEGAVSEEEQHNADPTPLRDRLLKQLHKPPAAALVVAAAGVTNADIVLSPIVQLPHATLRVLDKSHAPFTLWVQGREIAVETEACEVSEAVDALEESLTAQAADLVGFTRIAADALTLRPLVKGTTIAVATLNRDGAIELVGAPPLVLRTFNLILATPKQGFALLRNEYEFLINVPGQWRVRPGLRRGADAKKVPQRYWDLATGFGVKAPEICYLHPSSSELLEFWVGGGAHMATYTRMTTMEAAAESGRHAAAGLIFGLFQYAEANDLTHYKSLAGDFPAIFPVEENEIEDLSFFTALDDQMFAAGLPHLFDVLGLSQIIDSTQRSDRFLPEILARLGIAARDVPGLDLLSPKVGKAIAGMLAGLVSQLARGA